MTVDARVYDREFARLNEAERCIELMDLIVKAIDMTVIIPPLTVKFPHTVGEMDRVLEDLEKEGLGGSDTARKLAKLLAERRDGTYGYSTLVLIAESHISIHTFPEEGFYTFDIYSCKGFPTEEVKSILESFFGRQVMSINIIERNIPDLI